MKHSQYSRETHTKRSVFLPIRLALAILPASILLAISSGSVIAQDQVAEPRSLALEEVIVTAQRREEDLQDVPIAITAFSAQAIEKAMFKDVGDYIASVPNASFISNGSRSRRQISIRGVTNFLGVGGTTTTGFYVDDFSVAGSTINPPIMDIQQIEILRGPQATYFGRNAIGGGISITTKKPGNEFEGSAMVDYSSFDTIDLEGVVNIPLIKDTLAMRLNVKSTDSDGNIKNINPIGGGNDQDYKYFRGSMRWTPTDNLTVDAMFQYGTEDVGMREGVPSGVFSTFAGTVLYPGEFPDRNGDGKTDPFVDTVGFYPQNRDRVNFNFPQSVGTNLRNGVIRVDYTTSNLLFTSITGYVNSDLIGNGDIDGSSRDYLREYRNTENESISTEFRIQNTNDSDWQWSIGALYAEDEGAEINQTFIGDYAFLGLPAGFLIDRDDVTESTDTWAIFGQVDYHINDQWVATLGGRYSEETKESDIKGFSGVFQEHIMVKDSFTDFSPKVALSYLATDTTTYYGTISKGFKSGGVQVAPNPDRESYEPEELWNYEVGVKTDLLDRRLRLNGALFYMDWSDMQVAFQENVIDENGDFVMYGGINNADSATSKGAELSATALVSDHLLVNLNVGYLDAKFDKFVAFIDSQNHVLDGQTIPNSPEWTMSADAEYDYRINDTWSGYARLEWHYRDSIKATMSAMIQSGFPWDVPSYDYFNLRLGVENDNLRFVLYAENLFDENYYTNAYQKAFAGGLFIEPSFRRVGIRATYLFGN